MGTIPLLGRLSLASTALAVGLLFDGGFDKLFTGASLAPSAEAASAGP
jgi:hypothetical protein